MAIKPGDKLPDGTLTEMIDQETPGCTIGPNNWNVADLTKGKKTRKSKLSDKLIVRRRSK